MKWAVIYNGKVINNILWSGLNDWVYPFSHDELLENDNNFYKIGMYFENGVWNDPLPEEPKTPDISMVVQDLGESLKPYLLSQKLTKETLYMFSALYPEWKEDEAVVLNDIRSYKAEIYKVIQAHTTQANWTPDLTPALWNKFVPAGIVPAWVQPLGAQDAYKIGDKVTYGGFTWISTADNNVWQPGIYGWDKI